MDEWGWENHSDEQVEVGLQETDIIRVDLAQQKKKKKKSQLKDHIGFEFKHWDKQNFTLFDELDAFNDLDEEVNFFKPSENLTIGLFERE